MAVQVRTSGAWRVVPDADPVKGLYVRDAGTWKKVAALWYRDADTWKGDPTFLSLTAPPTNFRVTSPSNDYTGVNLAWDWSGGTAARNFIVRIRDHGTSSTGAATDSEVTLDPAARTYRASVASGHYAEFTLWAVSAPDNQRVLCAQTPRWYVGAAAYTVNDVPVYGWADTWEWIPPVAGASSQQAANFDPTYAADNNGLSSWMSVARSGAYTYEGIWVRMPYWAHHRVVGAHVWQGGTGEAMWINVGMYWSGGWWGSILPPGLQTAGNNQFIVYHNYYTYSYAADEHYFDFSAQPEQFIADASSSGESTLMCLTFGPQLSNFGGYGFGGHARVFEIRMLLQNWRVVSYSARTVAAVPSQAW